MSKSTAAAADIASILAFALLARIAHNSPELPLSFVGWLDTAWPFVTGIILGWILDLAKKWEPSHVAPGGVAVWLVTVITGLGIWGIRHSAFPHWSFIIVASSMSALFLLGWRAIAKRFR